MTRTRPGRWMLAGAGVVMAALGIASCDRSGEAPPQQQEPPPAALPHSERPAPAAPDEPELAPVPPGAVLVPTGDPETSPVMVEFVAGADRVRAGEPYEYLIRVTNRSPERGVESVVVRQLLPNAFEVIESDPPSLGRRSGEQIWSIDRLAPGEVATITAAGVIDDPAAGAVTSSVRVTFTPTLETVVPVEAPLLRLTKTAPEHWSVCELVPVTYTLTNLGETPTAAAVITDAFPEGTIGPLGDNVVTIDVPPLEPGGSFEETVQVRAAGVGELTSRAAARTEDGLEARSPRTTIRVQRPVLAMDVSGPGVEYTGSALRYVITVLNTGTGEATDARVHAEISGGAGDGGSGGAGDQGGVEVLGPRGASIGDGVVVVPVGTIPPGEARQAELTLVRRTPGEVTIAAEALAPCAIAAVGERIAATATTRIEGVAALHVEVADSSDPVQSGHEVVYEITVMNRGTAPEKGVQVTATLPGSLTLVEATGQTDAEADRAMPQGVVRFAPLETLAPGQRAVWHLRTIAAAAGDARVLVEVTSGSAPAGVTQSEATRID